MNYLITENSRCKRKPVSDGVYWPPPSVAEPVNTFRPSEKVTSLALAVLLASLARKPLTVITNSVTVVEQLSEAHGIEMICLGGRFNPRFNAFFGFVCEQAISSLRANTLFMSASTVFSGVAYHQQEDVVKTKRAPMGVADQRVLLVDSSKFGVTALIRLAALSDFDIVLTDSGIAPTEAEALRQNGVNLRVAKVQQ